MKKLVRFLPVLSVVMLLLACNTNTQNTQVYQRQDAETFNKTIQDLPGAQLIDVRTPAEFENSHIEGATNINVESSDFNSQIKKLDKDLPTLVYCRSGHRSSMATDEMKKKGFSKIYELNKGMNEWNAAGLPVTK